MHVSWRFQKRTDLWADKDASAAFHWEGQAKHPYVNADSFHGVPSTGTCVKMVSSLTDWLKKTICKIFGQGIAIEIASHLGWSLLPGILGGPFYQKAEQSHKGPSCFWKTKENLNLNLIWEIASNKDMWRRRTVRIVPNYLLEQTCLLIRYGCQAVLIYIIT